MTAGGDRPARARPAAVPARAVRVQEETARVGQRLEALGKLTGATAHELNNLLTVILSNAAILAAQLPPGERRRAELTDLESAARDATVLLQQLMAHARDAGTAPAPVAPVTARGQTILLVDDEEAVRRAAVRILERLGYAVHPAASGEEALALWRAMRDRVALVIIDVVLPQVSGPEVARIIRAEGGNVPILFASGYSPEEAATLGELAAGATFLRKPWTREELAEQVRTAITGAAAGSA